MQGETNQKGMALIFFKKTLIWFLSNCSMNLPPTSLYNISLRRLLSNLQSLMKFWNKIYSVMSLVVSIIFTRKCSGEKHQEQNKRHILVQCDHTVRERRKKGERQNFVFLSHICHVDSFTFHFGPEFVLKKPRRTNCQFWLQEALK